jgi:hypothetical protein
MGMIRGKVSTIEFLAAVRSLNGVEYLMDGFLHTKQH